ncbi:MAG: Na+/H+ antiporter subunit C [Alphaproteobacteria bacterium]|nr:Na+/H+ antiporter subunit C [Alphaproteobacteria bacterium]
MEVVLCILTGLIVACAIYLMLDRNLVKFLFGLVLMSNAANLILFSAGRLTLNSPAFIEAGETLPPEHVANALPQALILTAIVISFGLLAFSLVLSYRAYQEIGSVDMDELGGNTSLSLDADTDERAVNNTIRAEL